MALKDTDLVYSVKEYLTPGAQKTVLFFCPFGVKDWQMALPGFPIWHLNRNRYNVICYSYRTAIITHSVQLTITNTKAIIEDASRRILGMDPTTEVSCFGSSMGTVLAANVAVKHPRIKKLILNLSYADISDHIITLPGIRAIPTKRLQAYLDSVSGEKDLRAAFDPYSPVNLVHQFRGKKLLVYASSNDVVLKLLHTSKFHDALKAASIDFEYYQNSRGGHYFAALVNYVRYTRWLRFLQN